MEALGAGIAKLKAGETKIRLAGSLDEAAISAFAAALEDDSCIGTTTVNVETSSSSFGEVALAALDRALARNIVVQHVSFYTTGSINVSRLLAAVSANPSLIAVSASGRHPRTNHPFAVPLPANIQNQMQQNQKLCATLPMKNLRALRDALDTEDPFALPSLPNESRLRVVHALCGAAIRLSASLTCDSAMEDLETATEVVEKLCEATKTEAPALVGRLGHALLAVKRLAFEAGRKADAEALAMIVPLTDQFVARGPPASHESVAECVTAELPELKPLVDAMLDIRDVLIPALTTSEKLIDPHTERLRAFMDAEARLLDFQERIRGGENDARVLDDRDQARRTVTAAADALVQHYRRGENGRSKLDDILCSLETMAGRLEDSLHPQPPPLQALRQDCAPRLQLPIVECHHL